MSSFDVVQMPVHMVCASVCVCVGMLTFSVPLRHGAYSEIVWPARQAVVKLH